MIQDQTAPLRRVYVRDPRRDDLASWRTYGWLEPPDPYRAEQEHAAFRAELERAGVEPEYLELRSADDLSPAERVNGRTLLAIAARVGRARLIDNTVLGGE